MQLLIASICLVFALVALAWGAEDLTLATPIDKGSVTHWRSKQLIIDTYPEKHVSAVFYDPTPGNEATQATCVWDANTTPTAAVVISTLNTANLTANSLQKRLTTAAQTRGCLGAGNVTGTPE